MIRTETAVDARTPPKTRRSHRVVSLAFAFALLLGPATSWCDEKRTLGVPGVRGGVVATSEPVAAAAGAEVLRRGGNAVDAAAVVQFVLNVVEPQSSGIGGGGFMMIHLAKEKKTIIVDSRETAPAAATPDMFVTQSSFDLRSTSGYAVGVPGTLLGVATALEQWGTISLAEALAPAIALAADGFRVSPRLAESILSPRLRNEPGNPAYDEAREVFLPGDVAKVEGDLLIQKDLAKTFKLIAGSGVDAFYRGVVAAAIVAAQSATRTSNPDGRGRMIPDDLANYRVVVRDPIEDHYRGFRIVSMPPPSSGGLAVIQILKLLERFPLGDASRGFGFGSVNTLHVMIEAGRLTFADRAVWMGDGDFVDVPAAGLLSDEYVAMRSALIDVETRRAQVNADDPVPYDVDAQKKRRKVAAANSAEAGGIDTTHFTVVDRDGNIVSYTSTIETSWGTGLMVPGYGFLLNNELTDFNPVPAFNPDPDEFNPGANDVEAGKRPRSSMAPTMIFDQNKPLAAFGSPGGSTIIWSVTNMIVNLIDHGHVIQEAVDAPRIAQTSANRATSLELGFSDAVIAGLLDLGHSLRNPGDIGSVQAIALDEDERQFGAADKRRTGGVVSVRRTEIRPAAIKAARDDSEYPGVCNSVADTHHGPARASLSGGCRDRIRSMGAYGYR